MMQVRHSVGAADLFGSLSYELVQHLGWVFERFKTCLEVCAMPVLACGNQLQGTSVGEADTHLVRGICGAMPPLAPIPLLPPPSPQHTFEQNQETVS